MYRAQPLFIITECYPFLPGEQFLENEIPVWSRVWSGPVIVFPLHARGAPRAVPSNVLISTKMSEIFHSRLNRLMALVETSYSRVFWKEVVQIVRERTLGKIILIELIKSVVRTNLVRRGVVAACTEYGKPCLIYSYWFTESAYGSILSKTCRNVVSRAHGWDLYPERSKVGRALLRSQFMNRMTAIYPVSEDGALTLSKKYPKAKNIRVSRLGVQPRNYMAKATGSAEITLVSVSRCVKIKNIEKIIEAVRIISDRQPEMRITWYHIGGGPELDRLQKISNELLSETNVCWKFLGEIGNEEVLKFLSEAPIDAILNSSASEGIPVSIMEAMACGIPAIAPDVGGIRELVTNECGVLLGASPSSTDIADAILNRLKELKSSEMRSRAAEKIEKVYDVHKNFVEFIGELKRILRPEPK